MKGRRAKEWSEKESGGERGGRGTRGRGGNQIDWKGDSVHEGKVGRTGRERRIRTRRGEVRRGGRRLREK